MARAHAHSTEPPAPAGPLQVVVDLNRCQAYAQCCFFAPSVFTLQGEEALCYDPAPDQAQREHVLRDAWHRVEDFFDANLKPATVSSH